jgi:hypothetical protein
MNQGTIITLIIFISTILWCLVLLFAILFNIKTLESIWWIITGIIIGGIFLTIGIMRLIDRL